MGIPLERTAMLWSGWSNSITRWPTPFVSLDLHSTSFTAQSFLIQLDRGAIGQLYPSMGDLSAFRAALASAPLPPLQEGVKLTEVGSPTLPPSI